MTDDSIFLTPGMFFEWDENRAVYGGVGARVRSGNRLFFVTRESALDGVKIRGFIKSRKGWAKKEREVDCQLALLVAKHETLQVLTPEQVRDKYPGATEARLAESEKPMRRSKPFSRPLVTDEDIPLEDGEQ
jgi:hypothetical protein